MVLQFFLVGSSIILALKNTKTLKGNIAASEGIEVGALLAKKSSLILKSDHNIDAELASTLV
jgi:hypothetical protein